MSAKGRHPAPSRPLWPSRRMRRPSRRTRPAAARRESARLTVTREQPRRCAIRSRGTLTRVPSGCDIADGQIAQVSALALALALDGINGVSVAVTAFPGLSGDDDVVTRLVRYGERPRRGGCEALRSAQPEPPPADLRGALPPVKAGHFSAVTDPAQIGHMLRALDSYRGTVTSRRWALVGTAPAISGVLGAKKAAGRRRSRTARGRRVMRGPSSGDDATFPG